MKRILKSVYSYFCYDTTSYIAGKLESQSKNGSTSWGDIITGKISGCSSRLGVTETDEEEREESDRMEEEDSEVEDDNEDDIEDDVDDDEESKYSEGDADHQTVASSFERNFARRIVQIPPVNSDKIDSSVSKSPAKLISSFTVENILMGRQCSTSSSSSNSSALSSPGNTMRTASALAVPPPIPVYSPTSTCPPPAVTNVHTSLSCASSTSSSIVGVNWVSHPPVKYTKFTMLSPTAMSDEAQRKKKANHEPSSILTAKSSRIEDDSQEAPIAAAETAVRSFSFSTTSSQPAVVTPLNSILTTRENTTVAASSSSSNSSAIQVYPITSLTELSSVPNAEISAATTRLCPLPVVTTIPAASASLPVNSLDRKSTTTQGFSQPQQYVFIVPSNSVAMALPQTSQHQLLEDLGQAKRTSSNSVIIANSSGNRSALLQTATSQSPENNTTSIFSRKPGSAFSSEKALKSLNEFPDANSNHFRLIAPKQSMHASSSSSERGGKSKGMKRGSQKPHKLRFHMTTVVTKQKREPLKSSLTVESPSAIVSEMTGSSTSASPTSSADDAQDKNIAIESTITLSPNLYSVDAKSNKPQDSDSNKLLKYKDMHVETDKINVNKNGDVHGEHDGREVQKEKLLPSEFTSESKTKVRATRNYTRRKRELTFHLYEEPGATFRIKKACKE